MVNLTSFLMISTFIKLSLGIKELEANEISTLKSLWCILNHAGLIGRESSTLGSDRKIDEDSTTASKLR